MALHVGDVGVQITLTLKQDGAAVNIATASPKQIKIIKPSGEVVTLSGTFTTDGSDGKLYVVTESENLDAPGEYKARMYLTIGGWTGYSSPYRFRVSAI